MTAGVSLGQAVFVLGMHRSGTSCLTGCLEECGLALGEVNRSAPHNRKGNHENLRVMELQDELLRYNDGAWDRPPARLTWTDQHRRRRDSILNEYRGLPIFGIKDPRTLVTLDFWREADVDMSFVGSFRHPAAVAESLRKRNSMPRSRGLDLWARYNRLLVRWAEDLAFDLVSFDLPGSEYVASLAGAARRLGLDPPQIDAGFAFFDPALRHCDADRRRIPEETAGLYGRLKELGSRDART